MKVYEGMTFPNILDKIINLLVSQNAMMVEICQTMKQEIKQKPIPEKGPSPVIEKSDRAQSRHNRVLGVLASHPDGLTYRELSSKTGLGISTLRNHVRELSEEGRVSRRPKFNFEGAPVVVSLVNGASKPSSFTQRLTIGERIKADIARLPNRTAKEVAESIQHPYASVSAYLSAFVKNGIMNRVASHQGGPTYSMNNGGHNLEGRF